VRVWHSFFPAAEESAAFVIWGITHGDITIDVQWPLEASFDLEVSLTKKICIVSQGPAEVGSTSTWSVSVAHGTIRR